MIPLESTLTLLITAFLIAVLGFTYSYILTQPGEIFAGWFKLLDWIFGNDKRYLKGLEMHPVFKFIIGCEKCVSGQIAFWSYLFLYWDLYLGDFILHAFYHVLLVGNSIFAATLIKSLYKIKIEND